MLGIDISDRSIKVVEVEGQRTVQLRTVCWSALEPRLIRRGVIQDVQQVTAALRAALATCSPVAIQSSSVVASIPETQSFVRVIEIPDMPDADVEEAVHWAIRQHIPFDLDMVYLDWQPLARMYHERRQVLVGVVQRDVVDPLLQVLDDAGLMVQALELEAQAIVRSLLPKDSRDIRGVLIVDMAATSTNIVFFDRGVIRFTSSIQSGGDDLTKHLAQTLNIDLETAAEKKAIIGVQKHGQEDAVVFSLRAAVMELLKKIDQVVREMAMQLQEEKLVRAILLSGGSANLPGIVDVFAEVFPGIPVQMGNPWTNLVFDERQAHASLSPQDVNHFVTAIGLALREIEHV